MNGSSQAMKDHYLFPSGSKTFSSINPHSSGCVQFCVSTHFKCQKADEDLRYQGRGQGRMTSTQ